MISHPYPKRIPSVCLAVYTARGFSARRIESLYGKSPSLSLCLPLSLYMSVCFSLPNSLSLSFPSHSHDSATKITPANSYTHRAYTFMQEQNIHRQKPAYIQRYNHTNIDLHTYTVTRVYKHTNSTVGLYMYMYTQLEWFSLTRSFSNPISKITEEKLVEKTVKRHKQKHQILTCVRLLRQSAEFSIVTN